MYYSWLSSDLTQGRLLQWRLTVGERDQAPVWIQGQEEIYSQQAEWGVTGWKITRGNRGVREVLGKSADGSSTESRPGWVMRNLIRYQGSGIFTKLPQQDFGWNWTKWAKDRAQGWRLVRRKPWNVPASGLIKENLCHPQCCYFLVGLI